MHPGRKADANQEAVRSLEARHYLLPRLGPGAMHEQVSAIDQFPSGALDIVDLELDGRLGDRMRVRPGIPAEARPRRLVEGPDAEVLCSRDLLRIDVLGVRDADRRSEGQPKRVHEETLVGCRVGRDGG